MIRQKCKNTCLFIFAFRYELEEILLNFNLLSGSSMEGGFFMSKTKKMILAALFITLSIILSRFLSIKTPLLAISFNFVPVILSAMWLGPKYTVVVTGISDLIGAILFPFGEYFVGFTLSAVLLGLIYGFILYKKDRRI